MPKAQRSATLPAGTGPIRREDPSRYATAERPPSTHSLDAAAGGDRHKKHKGVFKSWFARKQNKTEKDGKSDKFSDLKADNV